MWSSNSSGRAPPPRPGPDINDILLYRDCFCKGDETRSLVDGVVGGGDKVCDDEYGRLKALALASARTSA